MLVRASMHRAGHAGGDGMLFWRACMQTGQLINDAHAAVMLHSHCKLNHFAQFLFMGGSYLLQAAHWVPRGGLLGHRLSASRCWYTCDCVMSCLTVSVFPLWLRRIPQCLPDGFEAQ